MKKYFYLSGIIAPIFYIAAVIIGGLLIPDYSHINQAISEMDPLIAENYRVILNVLFGLYNALTLSFGLLLLTQNKEKGRIYISQAICISIVGLCGALMFFFPMDIIGAPTTFKGNMHVVLAGIMAPLTILVALLGFWTFKENKNLRILSLIMSIIILICGGASAYTAANELPLMGLFERITITSYITWIFISAIYYKNLTK